MIGLTHYLLLACLLFAIAVAGDVELAAQRRQRVVGVECGASNEARVLEVPHALVRPRSDG